MPWQCQHCNTTIEDDDFEVCWNCNSAQGALFLKMRQISFVPDCLRCTRKKLSFIGTKNFHEGTRWAS